MNQSKTIRPALLIVLQCLLVWGASAFKSSSIVFFAFPCNKRCLMPIEITHWKASRFTWSSASSGVEALLLVDQALMICPLLLIQTTPIQEPWRRTTASKQNICLLRYGFTALNETSLFFPQADVCSWSPWFMLFTVLRGSRVIKVCLIAFPICHISSTKITNCKRKACYRSFGMFKDFINSYDHLDPLSCSYGPRWIDLKRHVQIRQIIWEKRQEKSKCSNVSLPCWQK